MAKKTTLIGATFGLIAVVLYGFNLRTGIASVAPVLGQLQEALGVSASASGLITALPGFTFALMGVTAVPIAKRLGLSPTLVLAAVLVTVGLIIRPMLGAFWPFLVFTFVVVAGIALGNVILPAWIKANSSTRVTVRWMSAYAATLTLSGAVAPLSALWFSGEEAWRGALQIWAIPAVLMLAVWGFIAFKLGRDVPQTQTPAEAVEAAQDAAEDGRPAPAIATVPIWKSKTAVAMLVFFGLQSSAAYMMMGWLPQLYIDRGVSPETASIALALIGFVGIIGGFIMPAIIARFENLTLVPLVLALLFVVGWVGVLWDTARAPLLWAFIFGVAGLCFPLALALLTARTRDPLVTARLSGFVQPGGYLMAGCVPLLVGVVYNATGEWTLIIFGMMALATIQGIMGIGAARNVFIDDELRAHSA